MKGGGGMFTYIKNERGLLAGLGVLLVLFLAIAGILSMLGYVVTGSTQYNRMHRMARDIADDPNSHTDEEITNALEEFHDMASNVVESGSIVPGQGGNLGVKLLLQAERKLNDVQKQKYIIKVTITPPDPGPWENVVVTANILNSVTGTSVSWSVSGTDGYANSGTSSTDENGDISFSIPGGGQGVTDTVTVTAGPVTEEFTYSF
jgi:hypothetical protein